MHSENLKTHEYMHSTFAWGEDKLKHEVNQGQRNYAQSFGEKHSESLFLAYLPRGQS